jgi:hypothetical protein
MTQRLTLLSTCLLVLSCANPAFADATAFIGVYANPDRQQVRGFAGGLSLIIVGFEGEYATAGEDETDGIPSLTTFSGNVFAQTPFPILGMRFYATTGVGAYREELDAIGHEETNVVFNTGGGAKISLIGPLRLRVDYRVLKLRGDPLRDSVVHRWYAGINLAF